jgi:uncharacterized iron-regulated protein
MRLWNSGYMLIMAVGLCWGTGGAALGQDRVSFTTIDLDVPLPLDRLVGHLATKRVVFVGETHDRNDNHLNQLEIIRRLHELDPNFAIGVEYFQQPFQKQVDDYIDGRIQENEFLSATEYYTRWGYDYRLYAPIFRYAREQHIPVRALNVPTALVSAVAKVGIVGLSGATRDYLPHEIEPADEDYRNRLREAFGAHAGMGPDAFNHFVEAQLVWDEGMAESAAGYLNANPGRRMVILCGAGHVEFGSGIPQRLERRTKVTYAIVLNSGEDLEPHIADYLLLSKEQNLPPPGVLGVNLEVQGRECRIVSLAPGGTGQKAGLRKRDVLVAINGQAITSIADVRLALWDKKPGDRVHIKVLRRRDFRREIDRDLEFQLAAPPKVAGNAAESREASAIELLW